MSDVAERRFGRYVVIERLGLGAMGAVYRARDESLGRDVAVKTIRAVMSELQAEIFRARFDNEARALAALSHPNVVNVFDVGIEDGTPFLVMELVEGRSLADRLDLSGCLGPDEARALGRQIGAALAASHARDIVHRDVKPANILEAEPGVWKLADFGIAHVPDSSVTLTGQFLGSPAYAAPEAIERGELGPAADVYGLGATLYEALAGTPPLGKGGVMTIGALAKGAAPRPLAEACPGCPAPLAAVITGAIAREPGERSTASQLVAALDRPAPAPVHAAPHVAAASPPAMSQPPPARDAPMSQRPSGRGAAIAVIAGFILIIGISLGAGLSSDDDATSGAGQSAPAAPAPAGRRAADRDRTERPPPARHDSKRARKAAKKKASSWRKVQKKLREGKLDKALDHLDEILELDPDDTEARDLYKEISGEDWLETTDEEWDDD